MDAAAGTTAPPDRVPPRGEARTVPDKPPCYNGETVRATKTLTDGPYWAGGIHNRQDYDDMGAAHGKGTFVRAEGHDRDVGNIVFADGHVDSFQDKPGPSGQRDAVWGVNPVPTPQGLRLRYNDLEGKVFGGWLNKDNPIVNAND
ncbi:MAG: hypothetical protein IBJ10_08765 [Phycisphaerales bacterium]|nr:hypothetical protein [Phycisphaerales bacterium]